MSDVFSRLAPFIQEYIYNKGWTELKSIQGEAIRAVLDDDRHILISAGTASGKTEAAFFPVLSQLSRQKCSSVSILYVGPLKALINDQFERLNDLLTEADIKVWRWHGDVSATQKKRLLEHPSGILQITPESLEAMMLRHTGDVTKLFGNLRYIVIDEVHAFMGADRGGQLLCQIAKIERWAGCSPRRIGLSATLGDHAQAAEWLRLGSERETLILAEKTTKKRIKLAVDYFEKGKMPDDDDSLPLIHPAESAYYEAIYGQCASCKSIIFTNSRSDAENVITHMREIAENLHAPDIFHVHHGSIAKVLRMEAEQAMREQEGATVTAATLTLELGIDIGKLERIVQVGAPYTCSSFVQRLGRSGRRTGVSEMYFTYLDEDKNSDDLFDAIPWPLLQMIAIIQLYIEERWIEPIGVKPLPLSLLYHQTMSMLASMGELTAAELARNVLSLPPFMGVQQEDYRQLLFRLLELEHLQKTDESTLIIGLSGEPIINHFTFYAVFPDEEEYQVSCDGRELGSINSVPPDHSCIALAGRSWLVVDVDLEQKHIFVKPAKKSAAKLWRGGGGDLHTKIVRRMREILLDSKNYPYLFERAQLRLQEARSFAASSGIANDYFTQIDTGLYLFTPWVGSKAIRTFDVIFGLGTVRVDLAITAVTRRNDYAFLIRSGLSVQDFKAKLPSVINSIATLDDAIDPKKIPPIDKYDFVLSPDLLKEQYLQNMLDLNEVKRLFQ